MQSSKPIARSSTHALAFSNYTSPTQNCAGFLTSAGGRSYSCNATGASSIVTSAEVEGCEGVESIVVVIVWCCDLDWLKGRDFGLESCRRISKRVDAYETWRTSIGLSVVTGMISHQSGDYHVMLKFFKHLDSKKFLWRLLCPTIEGYRALR